MSRQTLLCLLCVFLGISMVTMLWTIGPPLKPALAQPGDEGNGYAEAQLGPGKRVQLPAIDNENGWETWVQVQNVGTTDSGVVVFFWGDYSNECPTNDPGPMNTVCMRVPENAVWTLKATIPTQARSAIAYSVATPIFNNACEDAGDAVGDTSAWMAWEDTYGGTGEPLAVMVQRKGSNDFDTVVSSAYPGLTESMHGEGPPYQYFTPYAMRRYHNLYTEMVIQNSGDQCTPVSIYYREQGPHSFERIQRIEQLAPGESVRLRVPDEIKCEWLGSAYIQANQPLGIIVDQISFSKYCLDSKDRGTLLTYWAQPYKPAGDTLLYAGLLFRMWSGWQAGIQVQNLTQESLPTFVTVDFMDNSGGQIIFLGDWVSPNGATTFYLPAITDLGFNYLGAADIQSHKQVDYPSGRETDGQPIFAVVDVKKVLVYSDTFDGWITAPPGEAQGGAYNAEPLKAGPGWGYIALPSISKSDEATSNIVIRNNSNCNRIRLSINIYDATGAKHTIISGLWLEPKHSRLVDLANIGSVVSGFIGAGVVEVTGVEQLCDIDGDGHVDPEPVMPSVTVLNKGHPAGDITTVYDGIPYDKYIPTCYGDIFGQVVDYFDCDPDVDPDHLAGATVTITSTVVVTDVTGFAGMYEVEGVVAGDWEGSAVKDGFLTRTITGTLDCGEDLEQSWELACTYPITFTVIDSQTAAPVPGATVTITFTNWYNSIPWGAGSATTRVTDTLTTNTFGQVTFNDIPTGSDDANCPADSLQVINWSAELAGYVTKYSTATSHINLNDGSCTVTDPITPTVALDHLGYIQGYVWCGDGDDLYEPTLGDTPQQNTWVRLYDWQGTTLLDDTWTNASGWYQFMVQPNVSYDVIVHTVTANDMFITPNYIQIANFELCVTPHAITP